MNAERIRPLSFPRVELERLWTTITQAGDIPFEDIPAFHQLLHGVSWAGFNKNEIEYMRTVHADSLRKQGEFEEKRDLRMAKAAPLPATVPPDAFTRKIMVS